MSLFLRTDRHASGLSLNRNSLLRLLLALCLTLIGSAHGAWAATYYVATNGNNNNNGSQATPFATIQRGIDAANNGDTVLVNGGTYSGAGNRDLDFNGKNFTLRSIAGFSSTIIDCGGTAAENHRAFVFDSGESSAAVVQGFTITNGYISNTSQAIAGAVLIVSSSPTFRNCLFNNNQVFSDSSAVGGAVVAALGTPTFTNCIFTGNNARANSDAAGGAIFIQQNTLTLTNCSFSGNSVMGTLSSSGAAIYASSASAVNATNCIFYGDTGAEEFFDGNNSSSIAYSNIQGGYPGTGNIDANPLFTSSTNLLLQKGSPAVDAGTYTGAPADDIRGIVRPQGGGVDMGAYEVVNNLPSLTNITKIIREDNALNFTSADFTSAFSDPNNGDTLTKIRITRLPVNGTLRLNTVVITLNQEIAPASLSTLNYMPNSDFFGSDNFGWNASDGYAFAQSAANINISIASVNDAPSSVMAIPSLTFPEDFGFIQAANSATNILAGPANETAQTVKFLVSNSNPSLFIEQPAIDSNGTLEFGLAPDANGSATVTVRLQDNGGTDNGGVDTSAPQFFVISATPEDDLPVAQNDTATTDEDSSILINVLQNDIDVDGDTLSINAVTPGANTHGTLVVENTQIRYTPELNYSGQSTFSYTLSDGTSTTTGAVTVTVVPVNDAPVAQPQNVGTGEDANLAIVLTASDVDNASLNFSVVAQPQHGTLSGTAPNLTYTPAPNYNGSDSFSFRASDGSANSNLATISITVGGDNDAPTAISDFASTNEDTSVDIDVIANDRDVDGDVLRVVRVATTAATHGSVIINSNGTLKFSPEANFNGTALFTYTLSDGTLEASTTVIVTVNAVNDAPVARDQSTLTDEDTARSITLTATDVDNANLSYRIITQPQQGTLTGTAPNLTYTPAANYNGRDSFTFRANDGSLESNVATVTVEVGGGNDAPVAKEDRYVLTGLQPLQVATPGVLQNDSDDEGNALTAVIATPPAHGTLTLNANGSFVYTPEVGFNGEDSFTYRASDGKTNSNITKVAIAVDSNPTRTLSLSLPQSTLSEGASLTATISISRPTTTDVVVTLSSSDTLAATVPATITIAAGSTSATFPIQGVDDEMVDGNSPVVISAQTAEYGAAQANLTIIDNDVPTLTLTVAPSTFNENAGPTAARATLTRNVAPAQRLSVKLQSTDGSEVRVPQEVVFPSGASSVSFWIEAVEDRVADGAQTPSIVAKAAGFVDGSARVRVEDNGRVTQALTLKLTNTSGVWNEGTTENQKGEVSLPTALNRDAVITLSSSDTSLVSMPRAVLLRAGQKNAGFVFRILDNNQAQGTQRIYLMAKLSGIASAVSEVKVIDNDEPMLTLTLSKSSASEDSGVLMATLVARNTPTGSGMLVKLGNSEPNRVSTPNEVWIPSGRATTSFPISIIDNNVADGDKSVTLTVSRAGLRSDSATLQVLDNDTAASSNSATTSSVELSSGTAQVANSTLRLRFTAALDAVDATEAARWSVLVNDQVVEVESFAYEAGTYSVLLTLPEGTLRIEEPIKVLWKNLRDKQGRLMNGQTVLTAR